MRARWLSIPVAVVLLAGGAGWGADTRGVPWRVGTQEPEALARRAGCFDCHHVEGKHHGPSFRAIAARYRGQPGARDTLLAVVTNGGKLKWPEARGLPMPPYSERLSRAETERLVDWALRLE